MPTATPVPSAAMPAAITMIVAAVEPDTYPGVPTTIAAPRAVRAAVVVTRGVVAIIVSIVVIARWCGGVCRRTIVIRDSRPLIVTWSIHATAQHQQADH